MRTSIWKTFEEWFRKWNIRKAKFVTASNLSVLCFFFVNKFSSTALILMELIFRQQVVVFTQLHRTGIIVVSWQIIIDLLLWIRILLGNRIIAQLCKNSPPYGVSSLTSFFTAVPKRSLSWLITVLPKLPYHIPLYSFQHCLSLHSYICQGFPIKNVYDIILSCLRGYRLIETRVKVTTWKT